MRGLCWSGLYLAEVLWPQVVLVADRALNFGYAVFALAFWPSVVLVVEFIVIAHGGDDGLGVFGAEEDCSGAHAGSDASDGGESDDCFTNLHDGTLL